MKKKNSAGLTQYIVKILTVIPVLFSLTTNLMAEARYEMSMMRKKLISLTVCAFVFFVLLLTMWLSMVGMLMVYLYSLELNLILIFAITFLFNLLLLIIVALIAMRLRVDPSFPETRHIIKKLIKS